MRLTELEKESPCTNCFYKEIIPCCCCMEFIAWKRKLLRMKGADDYERATEQTEHDMLYEPTYNSEDGSM